MTILNESAPLPLPIDEHVTVGEEARLKHRYLDLRRPGRSAGAALRLRSKVGRGTCVRVELPLIGGQLAEGMQ